MLQVVKAKLRSVFITLVVVAVVLTGIIPGSLQSSAASGSVGGAGITLIGFSKGTQSDPYIHYESRLTISGTYVGLKDPRNLRLSRKNNGLLEKLSDQPTIVEGTSTFTFFNVGLKPGMNEIGFYELTNAGEEVKFTFYVIYNDTPVFSDLKVGNVPLSTDVTVPTIVYSSRPSAITGRALNATNVRVDNLTTNKSYTTRRVNDGGSFAIDMVLAKGYNNLRITALAENKEINLVERQVIYTDEYSKQGANDHFYNVKIEKTPLDSAGLETVVDENMNAEFIVSGDLLIHKDSTIEPFGASDPKTITDAGEIRIYDSNGDTKFNPEVTSPSIQYKDTLGEYLRYSFSVKVPGTKNSFEDGKKYSLAFWYPYNQVTVDESGVVTRTPKNVEIANHKYPIQYMAPNSPRIESMVLSSEGNVQVDLNNVNIVRSSPYTIELKTKNISDTTKFKISYLYDTTRTDDDDALAGQYEVTRDDKDTSIFRITIKKAPSKETDVRLTYDNNKIERTFKIRPEVVPHVQLSYVSSSGKTVYVEKGLTITDLSDPLNGQDLIGQVRNYAPVTQGNVKVKIGSDPVTITPHPSDATRFTIKSDDLGKVLEKDSSSGIRVLEITLENQPKLTFKYNISYINEVVPKIKDVKFEIEQNSETVVLSKKSTETDYNTSALYLSGFSFDVEAADEVTVKKDGKVIAVFKDKSGTWEFQKIDPDYLQSLKAAVQGTADSANTKLDSLFTRSNFESTGNSSDDSFRAEMDDFDYVSLLNIFGKMDKEEATKRLPLFPLVLQEGGSTTFEISAAKGDLITRQKYTIKQTTHSWIVLDPMKREGEDYVTVNANSAKVRIFAENAEKILFGKEEVVAKNTTDPEFEFNDKLGRPIPTNGYYMFESTVSLKPGLNTVKYTVVVNGNQFKDEIKIYNAGSSVSGAVYRDILGKKVSFSVFEKALELKFPTGTVLLSPSDARVGGEVNHPRDDINIDVPLYFGIADRSTGQVDPDIEPDSDDIEEMEDILKPDSNFNYASPLYYIDAGVQGAPGGTDPYYQEDDVLIRGKEVDLKLWHKRYRDNLVPSKQGTLSIKYDSSIVNAANTTLAIMYNNGEGWVNIGGVVNTGKKTITVPFRGFGYYMALKIKNSFPDVVNHEFARDAIETLYSKGIMVASDYNWFGADMKITRGEFATMIVKALDLPINAGPYRDEANSRPSSPTFSDVDRNDNNPWNWSYEYIETAARAGIVRGKDAERFFPDDSLTREEAAIIIARALNLKTGNPDTSKVALGKMFTDAHLTGYYAVPSVLAVTKAKIMNGEPNDATAKKPTYRFNPRGDLTRAEMAVITYRIMVQLKKLPKQ
ncbi:S-layer homology domain-containing protein [Brevibacillus agri]|uniref:S-layer homology domain-containing protein n=1 Tax=Brevibacillus agri TaxID=51101 RepID=UPI002E229E03|nr:S-layer homology domain-containing protein [Brevibacillus agri]MED1655167.1 S-layer homology domain-containing protein [Brevibacillus agri]MED1687859.1 S-layer homology domain-containing protein [Brevibacillus agri]MED1693044.1 S-layer homology domain-containing protein [Brevibacillus agri]MED1698078.1 S-layer homology domain-containing protein [Brevibacillus agri]